MGAPILSRLGGSVSNVTVSGNVTVIATDLDIRNLSHTQDSIRIGDGVDLVDVFNLTNSKPLAVAVVNGSGNQITSFVGSTVTFPVISPASSFDLAAGASVNLDGATIPAAKTGKLLKVTMSSSVACKWVIKTRNGGVEVGVDILYTSGVTGKPSETWETPDPAFVTLAGAGVDENFRVTATNLDKANAADVHATFYWDEVNT